MKRFLVTILSVLYMASAMGATVHLHYCMGEYMGASLIHEEEHHCAKCGMTKTSDDNGCCKDEHKTFKTSEHQSAKAAFDQIVPAAIPQLPVSYYCYSQRLAFVPVSKVALTAHAPPSLWRVNPIYLTVRNFRI